MARQARVYIPNTAQLVQVRGINGAQVFFNDADYVQWQAIVRTIAPVHSVDIHAFALQSTHIYLLVTAHDERALGGFMQDLGRRYVRYVNGAYQRTGTLWEGRYRTAFIQDAPYVLQAYVWLDSMGEHTSKARHLGVQMQEFIRDHGQFWQLGNTPFERQHQLTQLLQTGIGTTQMASLAHAVQTGWSLGDAAFIAHAEQVSGRRISPAARGRPKKA